MVAQRTSISAFPRRGLAPGPNNMIRVNVFIDDDDDDGDGELLMNVVVVAVDVRERETVDVRPDDERASPPPTSTHTRLY